MALWILLGGSSLAGGQQPLDNASLISQLDWVKLDIVQGRIGVLAQPRYTGSRTHTTENVSAAKRQSLSLSISNGLPYLRFEQSDAQQQLTFELSKKTDVTLARDPQEHSDVSRVRLAQDERRIVLTVEQGGGRREFVERSLWHLLLAEPDTCRQHVIPLLEYLRPNWRLESRTEQLRETLFRVAESPQLASPGEIRQLVKQLSSSNYRDRQRADRELRRLGPRVLCFLAELDPAKLDAEQRLRIRKIRRAMEVQGFEADAPMRVAAWLISDKKVWLNLLDDPLLAHRALAAAELARLCERPLDYDPAASDEARRQQVDRLKTVLADG